MLFALALLVLALWSSFGYSSICPTCGSLRSTRQLQVPFTNATYCSWNRDGGVTPVGTALARTGMVPPNHAHDWRFMHGAGNGVSCAIGEGRHLFDPYQSDNVANFIEAMALHDPTQLDVWLGVLRDPKRTSQIRSVANGFPVLATQDAATYLEWKKTNQWLLDEYRQLLQVTQ